MNSRPLILAAVHEKRYTLDYPSDEGATLEVGSPRAVQLLGVSFPRRCRGGAMMGTHRQIHSLSSGRLVGGCRIVRLLGQGGMGEVYLAEHLPLQKPVALKILPPALASKERVDRFFKEARVCSRIEHPNVVVIHDVGEQDGLYYIVMQYVRGRNLTELLLAQGGPLPVRSALRLIELAGRGLHAVHSQGLVHRDIKPSNIMLSQDSRVLLMDFGLVREELDSSLTQTGQLVGTPSFMSPEQCRGKPLDRRSDIYCLGSTLYCLLSGEPPFKGTLQEILTQIASGQRLRPVHHFNRDVPPEVSDLVAKAMAPRPEDRFATASAMVRQLKTTLRALQLKSTSTWKTAEISGSAIETQPVLELPVELLPLETTWESLRRRLPMIGGVAGLAAFLLMVALLLHFWAGSASRKPDRTSTTSSSRKQPSVSTQGASSGGLPDMSNMVFIEKGYAQLGISDVKLTSHFESIPALRRSDLSKQLSLLQARELASMEPQRRAFVPGFWIDKHEVTNAEYGRFLEATDYEDPEGWEGREPPPGREDHPVRNIRHRDAEAYAKWAGKKLPTREQWMRAFRGDTDWLFPWGDQFDPSRANVLENPGFPASTSRVTATPGDKSLFGVFNMVGNVCEYLREQVTLEGQAVDVAKGASFGQRGQGEGVGPMSTLVQRGGADRRLGFRCVLEHSGEDTTRAR